MSWKCREIYVGRVFAGEPIGLIQEGLALKAYYGPIYLGIIGDNKIEFERRPGRIKI